jgi:hypothetical protein
MNELTLDNVAQEMKGMEGILRTEAGDIVEVYVAAIDPKVGVTVMGWPEWLPGEEVVCGCYDLQLRANNYGLPHAERVLLKLMEIYRDTGEFMPEDAPMELGFGTAGHGDVDHMNNACAFMK